MPLFLKTYGRQRRKLPAWISPESHKQAFDSTLSTDGDISVFEPPKPTKTRGKRTSVASRRVVRPAKKKANLCLTEKSFDDKNINSVESVIIPPSPHPLPAQQSKRTRRKKIIVCSDRAVCPAKRRNVCLTDNSSDEENICRPSPPHPQPAKQSKTCRKSQLVSEPGVSMRQKLHQVPITSYSEKDSVSAPQCHEKSVQLKKRSIIHPPSVGRFVTRRRCAAKIQTKPKLRKEVSILNYSDDFSSSRIITRKRRRVPPTFIVSSAENSVNVAGTSSFATNPLREISLNELSDHSLGPCSRKPIFCSTPSAGSFNKRPRLKPLPTNDQSSTPLSMSVSCIGVLSPFQENVDTAGQLIASPHSASPTGLQSNEKQHLDIGKQEIVLSHHEERSGELFMAFKNTNPRISCSEDTKSHSEEPKTKSSGEFSCLNLLSTDSESSSNFVTSAAELEWLIEALKEKCLTEHCTVQLERLDILTLTHLCSQTTYSSCLGDECSVQSQQTSEHPVSVDSCQTVDLLQSSEASFNLCLSAANNKSSDYFLSVNSLDSSEQAACLTDSQSSNILPSIDYKQSAEYSSTREFITQSASVLYVESTHHTNSSPEFIISTQLPASNSAQTVAMKDKCAKKCTVPLQKLPLSQVNKEQCKGFRLQKESHLTCDDRSVNPSAKKSEHNHTHKNPDDDDVSVRWSMNNMSAVVQIQSTDPETEKEKKLKEKCFTNKPFVDIRRVSLSELNDILNLKDSKLKSPVVVLDSASDDQTSSDHQSDTNHCNEDTLSTKVNMKKRASNTPEDKVSSDLEEVVKSSCDILPKRKKMSLALKEKKRRSTSTDRPGTTRKACVSGLSVSRWKNNANTSTHMFRSRTAQSGGVKAVDCSIGELISTQHKQPREPGAVNFSTPVRANPLNLSSLLADFTPNTYTWSRLKAALSVHRKGMVLLTPKTLVSSSPGRANLADISLDLFATPLRTPLPKHLRSQLYRNDSLTVCEDADLSDAEKVYAECGQRRPLPWEECILPNRMKRCVKIGEGTFGEVFSTTSASGDTVALKVIPVEGSEKVNGETQKTFGEILHEIIISKELSSLKEKQHNQTPGFIGLNDLHCVQGCYPPDFLNAWDRFDQQKSSENDRPDFFPKDQLFIILEFEFGGIDLENSNGTLASLGVAKSILHQVTAALAVAEEELHFEHRDLHWGNVLVKTTKQKTGSFLLNGTTHSLETKGVLVRIIDYSLSRLEIDELTVSCDISKDEELFMGQGDYQFEIYRLMRKENGNNWSDYHPHTNVLWLRYLCSKLLSMKYRGPGGRVAKEVREELTRFYDSVLQYSSATEALRNCPMFQ